MFPKRDDEKRLLAEYQAEDAGSAADAEPGKQLAGVS
jgi:hypothetical protein